MARPTKQGIDYFPLDCQFDDKIEMFLIEKEAIGLAALICIWQIIYSNEGYYTKDGNDLFLLVKKRVNVGINDIKECVNICLDRNIFDKKLHKKHGILTSKAIQKRFFDAAKKKKVVFYDIDYIINGVNVGGNATNVNVKEEVKEEEKEELHSIQKYIKKNLSNVSKLKKQLTFEECERLLKEFDSELVKKTLDDMENYSNLKKYTSVNLTLRKWMNNAKN